MTNLHRLHELKQSTWLNFIRRTFIQSGELRARIVDGIQGITANAAAFESTIAACTDYDRAIQQEMAAGTPARRIHEKLMADDVQVAADVLHTVYEESGRLDGFVSLEIDPTLVHEAANTLAAVRHLEARFNRANVMVEIPATPAGIESLIQLTEDGSCMNMTHIFSVAVYEQVAEAYLTGLERYFESHSIWRRSPTSVASFSIRAIDEAVDPMLVAAGHPELQGKTAVAMAKVLYDRFCQIFSGARWEKLARQGGHVLRPKWSRITPPPNYHNTFYVEALIGPNTVTTFSPTTLNAFLDHGSVTTTLTEGVEEASQHLTHLAKLGIDLPALTHQLQRQYIIASEKQFQSITQSVMRKRDELEYSYTSDKGNSRTL